MTFSEDTVCRDGAGRFDEKPQSAPEVRLPETVAAAPARLKRCEHNAERACERCVREDEKFGAFARMMNRWAASTARREVRTWTAAKVGDTGGEHRPDGVTYTYTVTERGVGYAVATFEDGETRTVYAPPPLA